MKTRDEIKAALQKTGYWKPFVQRREQLKKQGLAPAKAFEQAWKEIQEQIVKSPFPKPGSLALAAAPSSSSVATPTPSAATPPTQAPAPAPSIPLTLPPSSATTSGRANRQKKRPKPNVGDDADWVYVTLPAAVEAMRQGQPLREFPTEPPSPGALGLLAWGTENADKFYDLYLARRLPNRTAIDADDKKGESGKSMMELARELDNAIADGDPDEFSLEGPADDEGEHSVSPEADGEGGEG